MSQKLLNRQIVEKELGSGATGLVQLCRMIKDEKVKVAVKQISLSDEKRKKSELLKEVKNEIEILMNLDHPQIVKQIDFHLAPENIYIVTEFLAGTELLEQILKESHLAEPVALKLFQQILVGINHTHQMNVIHRDIKAENIVFKDTNYKQVKLIDQGLGINNAEKCQGIVGTPFYMAPELFLSDNYDKKVDVWSLGVLQQTMLSGQPPFNGDNNKEIIQAVIKGNLSFHHKGFQKVSSQSIELIKLMLERSPSKRISLKDVLSNPVFAQVEGKLSSTLEESDKLVACLRKYKDSNHMTKAFRIKMTKLYEGLNDDVQQNLKEMFLCANKNKRGRMSREEFFTLLDMLSIDQTEGGEIWDSLDISKDGEIEQSNFLTGFTSLEHINMRNACKLMQSLIDSQNNNKVTLPQFKKFVNGCKIQLETEELEALFNEVDKKKSGHIGFDEFTKSFKKSFDLNVEEKTAGDMGMPMARVFINI